MDTIEIKDLSLRAIIGVYPEERKEKQDIILNILLSADLRKAGRSDRLEDTVDYKALKKAVIALVETSSFTLIEALAEAVAGICLTDKRVRKVRVSIDKPGALRFARSVAVTVERSRRSGRVLGLLLCLFLSFTTAVQAIERIEPELYLCFAKEIVIHKEPQMNSEPVGHLLFGMPAVALARHNEWFGVYLSGGVKGWLQVSDVTTPKIFMTQYSHLSLNESVMNQLMKEALLAAAKRQTDPKLGEIKSVKVKGESEEIYVRKDNVNIRAKPGLNARPVRKAFIGEAFVPAGMVRGFYRIEYDEAKFGWIAEEMASPDTIEYSISLENAAGAPREPMIYILTAPSPEAVIQARAYRDFQYEILKEQSSWYQIRIDSLRTGWVRCQDFRIVRPGSKALTPSAQTAVAQPTNTGQATGVAVIAAPSMATPTRTDSIRTDIPAALVRDTAVSKSALPAAPDSVKTKPVDSLMIISARLDSLKSQLTLEIKKKQEWDKQMAEAKKDSAAVKGKLDALKAGKLKELDSLRLALNERALFVKDSLSIEREKLLTLQNATEAIQKIKKQKEDLLPEIAKLRASAKESRERAKNLKELAKYEFDVDTSTHAKDSLNLLSKSLDSSAQTKETLIKNLDARITSLSSVKPEEVTRSLAVVDSVEKALPETQKAAFSQLVQKQAGLDQMLAAAKTQMQTDAREKIKQITVELKNSAITIKRLESEVGLPAKTGKGKK